MSEEVNMSIESSCESKKEETSEEVSKTKDDEISQEVSENKGDKPSGEESETKEENTTGEVLEVKEDRKEDKVTNDGETNKVNNSVKGEKHVSEADDSKRNGAQEEEAKLAEEVGDNDRKEHQDIGDEEGSLPPDFFDDFFGEDFLEGLDVVDSWVDDEDEGDSKEKSGKEDRSRRGDRRSTNDRRDDRRDRYDRGLRDRRDDRSKRTGDRRRDRGEGENRNNKTADNKDRRGRSSERMRRAVSPLRYRGELDRRYRRGRSTERGGQRDRSPDRRGQRDRKDDNRRSDRVVHREKSLEKKPLKSKIDDKGNREKSPERRSSASERNRDRTSRSNPDRKNESNMSERKDGTAPDKKSDDQPSSSSSEQNRKNSNSDVSSINIENVAEKKSDTPVEELKVDVPVIADPHPSALLKQQGSEENLPKDQTTPELSFPKMLLTLAPNEPVPPGTEDEYMLAAATIPAVKPDQPPMITEKVDPMKEEAKKEENASIKEKMDKTNDESERHLKRRRSRSGSYDKNRKQLDNRSKEDIQKAIRMREQRLREGLKYAERRSRSRSRNREIRSRSRNREIGNYSQNKDMNLRRYDKSQGLRERSREHLMRRERSVERNMRGGPKEDLRKGDRSRDWDVRGGSKEHLRRREWSSERNVRGGSKEHLRRKESTVEQNVRVGLKENVRKRGRSLERNILDGSKEPSRNNERSLERNKERSLERKRERSLERNVRDGSKEHFGSRDKDLKSHDKGPEKTDDPPRLPSPALYERFSSPSLSFELSPVSSERERSLSRERYDRGRRDRRSRHNSLSPVSSRFSGSSLSLSSVSEYGRNRKWADDNRGNKPAKRKPFLKELADILAAESLQRSLYQPPQVPYAAGPPAVPPVEVPMMQPAVVYPPTQVDLQRPPPGYPPQVYEPAVPVPAEAYAPPPYMQQPLPAGMVPAHPPPDMPPTGEFAFNVAPPPMLGHPPAGSEPMFHPQMGQVPPEMNMPPNMVPNMPPHLYPMDASGAPMMMEQPLLPQQGLPMETSPQLEKKKKKALTRVLADSSKVGKLHLETQRPMIIQRCEEAIQVIKSDEQLVSGGCFTYHPAASAILASQNVTTNQPQTYLSPLINGKNLAFNFTKPPQPKKPTTAGNVKKTVLDIMRSLVADKSRFHSESPSKPQPCERCLELSKKTFAESGVQTNEVVLTSVGTQCEFPSYSEKNDIRGLNLQNRGMSDNFRGGNRSGVGGGSVEDLPYSRLMSRESLSLDIKPGGPSIYNKSMNSPGKLPFQDLGGGKSLFSESRSVGMTHSPFSKFPSDSMRNLGGSARNNDDALFKSVARDTYQSMRDVPPYESRGSDFLNMSMSNRNLSSLPAPSEVQLKGILKSSRPAPEVFPARSEAGLSDFDMRSRDVWSRLGPGHQFGSDRDPLPMSSSSSALSSNMSSLPSGMAREEYSRLGPQSSAGPSRYSSEKDLLSSNSGPNSFMSIPAGMTREDYQRFFDRLSSIQLRSDAFAAFGGQLPPPHFR